MVHSNCKNCSKDFKYNKCHSTGKYCSNKCQKELERKGFISEWRLNPSIGVINRGYVSNHIRNYLFETHDYKCSQCGWNEVNSHTNKTPLEIDHIDGNRQNAKEDNLRVLCPNCHSLTPTYKGANKKK